MKELSPDCPAILIADNTERNKGFGRKTINAILTLLFIDDIYDKADLNVYAWNSNAIKCYEGAGFEINKGVTTETPIGNEIWKGLNMQVTKSSWIAKTQ